MKQPILETWRLRLRPFEGSDAARVQSLAGAWEVADTTLHIPHPYPDGAAEGWIATHAPAWDAGKLATFAIILRESEELIGAVGLSLTIPHARGELGYWVGRPYWSRGYCTEAARAVVAFGFDALRLHRIQSRHLTRNPASGRVMIKLGMKPEGVNRETVRKGDRFEDLAVYGILAAEWAALREEPGVPPAAGERAPVA